MPLATSVLQANLQRKIKSILDASFNENSNAETIKTKFAKDLSSAIADEIDTWIKTATITVNAGIPVATAGSPTAQTGATTGPGTATIM
jgi:hypothetical protein